MSDHNPGPRSRPHWPALLSSYYTNVGDLAGQQHGAGSRWKGTKVKVSEGLYEVTPNTPGGDLDRIATHFSSAATEYRRSRMPIRDASTGTSRYPLYTAIRLPRIDVSVGTSPGGTSLSSIAYLLRREPHSVGSPQPTVEFADGRR